MKEMRIKGEYVKHETITGSVGIKIYATDLEKVVAGSELYVANSQEDEEFAL